MKILFKINSDNIIMWYTCVFWHCYRLCRVKLPVTQNKHVLFSFQHAFPRQAWLLGNTARLHMWHSLSRNKKQSNFNLKTPKIPLMEVHKKVKNLWIFKIQKIKISPKFLLCEWSHHKVLHPVSMLRSRKQLIIK